jgi:hypothetical protein
MLVAPPEPMIRRELKVRSPMVSGVRLMVFSSVGTSK